MSIIYDALQKTQLNRNSKRDPEKRRAFHWFDMILIAIIICLFIIVVVTYYPRLKSYVVKAPVAKPQVIMKANPNVTKEGKIEPVQPSQLPAKHPPVEELFSKPTKEHMHSSINPVLPNMLQQLTQPNNEMEYKGKLAFKGVFLSDDEKIVMIDKHTYHLGDMVDGMKIVSINIDSVKLQSEDQILVMRSVG